jgi:hypothetical protein
MMTSLRKIEALPDSAKLLRNPIPPPPKIAWFPLDQLVIDESYQRSLSNASRALIRRLVTRWDWNCFKPLSVAATGGGLYEIIDGQHTAIAAATHGAIELLPCLVLDATTVAQRSAAFVGINRDRVALTPFALFRARLAAEDEEAVAVKAALEKAGCQLEESLRYMQDYPAGTVACVSTLLQIVRRGGAPRLARLLNICKSAEISPVPSAVLKGLEEIITTPGIATDAQLIEVLLELGGDTIVDKAGERRRLGQAGDQNTACMQVILHALEAA